MKDIFDVISPDKERDPEILLDTEFDGLRSKLMDLHKSLGERQSNNQKIFAELRSFIHSEISKLQVKQNVVERIVEKQPIIKNIHIPVQSPPAPPVVALPAPPQIIKEVRVEVPAKDTRKLVEESSFEALKSEIEELKKELKETRRMAESPIVTHGGPGVIGIPPPEPNPEGYVLTVSKGKAVWAASSSNGINPIYSGDPTSEGTWRLNDNGTDWVIERLESSVWVEKARFQAS